MELTRELSATAFLLAFRHFTSRRGLPKVIMSDNAVIQTLFSRNNEDSLRPRSPWLYDQPPNRVEVYSGESSLVGGKLGHLVQSVKRCLKKTI